MPDYGRPLEFGIALVPDAATADEGRRLVRQADRLGLDFVGIEDHPYQQRFLDTFALIAVLLAETERIRVVPDVGCLPLRPPAMIAKAAATLDLLSGGRFELGLGAGAFWEGIEAMGGPTRTPGESVEALEEAIEVIRLFWSGGRGLRYEGRHYRLRGVNAGPPPPHPIEVWIGAYRPRMLSLTGRRADGWIPSLGYLPPSQVPEAAGRIDAAAVEAGREPGAIRRAYNLMGEIADEGEELPSGPPALWVEELTRFSLGLGFDTFVFRLQGDLPAQLERLAAEIVPAVREAVESERRAKGPG